MKKILISLMAFTSIASASYQVPQEVGVKPLEQNPDVEKQIQGNYDPMNRPESYPLGSIQKAWNRTGGDAGIYKVIFHPSEVIKFRVREFMTTTIVFPKWERIRESIIGDISSYGVRVISPHVISVKSLDNIGVDSTITLIGESGRVYSFYVRTEGYNSKNISDVAVYVKVPYSGPDPSKPLTIEKKDPEDYLQDAYFDPSKIRFDFSMAGDKEIAPERVYSDGIRTWFDFGARIHQQNLPTVYKIEDGVDTPVNVSRDGNKIVAQAAGFFTLKHGQKTVCVMPSPKGDA